MPHVSDPPDADAARHWDEVYGRRCNEDVSWHQPDPWLSLELIQAATGGKRARIIDAGGGTSVLADRLLDLGHSVTVLDISDAAIRQARERLGHAADDVDWIVGDVTQPLHLGPFDLWHDRAVFHFLTDASDRRQYLVNVERSLAPGGHLLIATFGPEGPEQCSGLPVRRYDAAMLAEEVGPAFEPVRATAETHRTPWRAEQPFVYCLFRRR